MNRLWSLVIMMATIIIADQITKSLIQQSFNLHESIPVIKGFFNITYVRNPGAAFGMFGTAAPWIRKPLFLYVPVLACFLFAYLIWKERNTPTVWQALAFSLILSGAVGNLIDRFSLDYVVDFLDFHWKETYHYPAFNVADSAITVGGVIIVIISIGEYFEERKKKKAKKA